MVFSSAKLFVSAIAALTLAVPGLGFAQGVMQLENPPELYELNGFQYAPPTLDGWKQLVRSPESFEIIYALRSAEDAIDSKLHIVGRTFPIENPDVVRDGAHLVSLARAQQIEKRKDILIALSVAEQVAGTNDVWTYTLIVPSPLAEDGDETRLHEDFYVALAPDKSSYFVLNAITEDEGYREQPWFLHFFGSLASVKHSSQPESAEEGAETESKEAAPSADGE